jgi:hypothetical protein
MVHFVCVVVVVVACGIAIATVSTLSSVEAFTAVVAIPKYSFSSERNYPWCFDVTATSSSTSSSSAASRILMSSDWSGFGTLDYDDDDEEALEEEDKLLNDGVPIDRREYATENDSDEIKQQVGAALDPPTIDDAFDTHDGSAVEPLFVPAGSQLPLEELTVVQILQACREEIGTVFGYAVENRAVGITGGVDYVGLDGPSVVISLKGRFWHQRTTVLERVANYLQQRIPEIIEVNVEDEWQLTDEANEVF